MALRRTPVAYANADWADYRSGVLDGCATLLDTVSHLCTLAGAFKAVDNNWPLSPNLGVPVGSIDDPGALPKRATGEGNPCGYAAVRVSGSGVWHAGFVHVDTNDTAGPGVIYIQSDATGVITEAVYSLTYEAVGD